MQVGYFNKNSFNARLTLGMGLGFTLWETMDGKVVPVTVRHSAHGAFSSNKELLDMGELKEEIQKLSIPEVIQTFGRTVDEVMTAIKSYKSADEVREILALT